MKPSLVAVAVMLAVGFSGVALAGGKARQVELTGVLNLNAATARQLDLLPGVGEKAAGKIIAQREKAPFKRPEELVKVRGFGKKKFERLKAYLTVAGPTTLEAKRSEGDRSQARAAPKPQR